jgi:hypothetical protein
MAAGCDDSPICGLDHLACVRTRELRGRERVPDRSQGVSVEMATITMRAQRRRLVNAALDAYAGWREQCRAVDIAYRRWESAHGYDAEVCYSAFSAALDHEERAAGRYASLLQRVGSFVAADLEPMKGRTAAAGRR